MQVKFKRLCPKAQPPQQMTAGAAGFDLVATSYELDYMHDVQCYGTSLAFEIPEGHVGLLFPRSSVYRTGLKLANCVGVIDSDYRGEVTFKFYTNSERPAYYVGDRVGQLVVLPIPHVDFVEVDELGTTERGAGAYGSTGK